MTEHRRRSNEADVKQPSREPRKQRAVAPQTRPFAAERQVPGQRKEVGAMTTPEGRQVPRRSSLRVVMAAALIGSLVASGVEWYVSRRLSRGVRLSLVASVVPPRRRAA